MLNVLREWFVGFWLFGVLRCSRFCVVIVCFVVLRYLISFVVSVICGVGVVLDLCGFGFQGCGLLSVDLCYCCLGLVVLDFGVWFCARVVCGFILISGF